MENKKQYLTLYREASSFGTEQYLQVGQIYDNLSAAIQMAIDCNYNCLIVEVVANVKKEIVNKVCYAPNV